MNLTLFLTNFVIGVAITLTASFLLRQVLPRFTRRTASDFDDFVLKALSQSVLPFGIVVVLLLTQTNLGLPNDIQRAYDVVLRIIGTVVIVRFMNRVGSRFLEGVARRAGDDLEQLFRSLQPLSLIHI